MRGSKRHEFKATRKTEKDDNFRNMKERVKQIMGRQHPSFQAIDGTPLNYSFKKIRHLDEVRTIVPKEGVRKEKPPVVLDEFIKEEKKEVAKDRDKEADREEEHKEEGEEQPKKKVYKGPEIIRTISLAAPAQELSPQQHVKAATAAKPAEKKRRENIKIEQSCTALFLSYNKIESIETLPEVVRDVMLEPEKLMWLDLSHNRLTSLDCDLSGFGVLRTLYLHCNYLFDTAELLKLKLLPSLAMLMIHANPLEKVPEFRALLIGLLQNLVKIDSVLVSRKERERALYLLDSMPVSKAHELKLPKASREEPPPSDDEDDS